MKKIKFLAALLCASLFIACKDDKVEVYEKSFELAAGSKAVWEGSVVGGPTNTGTINLTGKGFHVAGERIIGGEITITVNSIDVTNLSATEKPILMNHLRTADFFNMALHPTVTYAVVSTEKLPTPDAAGNNYKIYGTMKLLGTNFPLQIPAKITITNDKITVKSTFKFDRTIWGMNYASVIPENGMLIEKDVTVKIDLVAEREK